MSTNTDADAVRRAKLVVVVGNPEFQHGRTRLELDGSGSARVTNQQGEKETVLEGAVAAGDAERVLRSVPDVLAGIEEKRLGVPDEARYRFELELDDRKAESATLWESQLEESERGRSLLQTLRRIVADVSERTVVL
jgi:hypothetical protein